MKFETFFNIISQKKEKKEKNDFFENTELLDEAYSFVQEYESGKIDEEKLNNKILDKFKNNDENSYDCHSFLKTILMDLNIPVKVFNFEKLARKNFEYEVEYKMEYSRKIKSIMDKEENKEYIEKEKKFTEEIYKNSEHFTIKNYLPDNYKECQSYAKLKAKAVAESLQKNRSSRILLISNIKDEEFCDAHSTIILGETKNSNDLWVIEKEDIGAPVRVLELSKVIESYCYNFYYDNLEINVCDKSAKEMCSS